MLARGKKTPKMVLIGVFANRNWILGNWLRECKSRAPRSFKIRWVPTIYGNKRFLARGAITAFRESPQWWVG
jgi:hypothetical protein